MQSADVEALLDATRDTNANARRRALHELCPCHVKANHGAVWDRIIELTADPDPGVRRLALHAMVDGSPRAREAQIVTAMERLRNDEHPKLRRHVRRLLAQYRRTGRINVEGA